MQDKQCVAFLLWCLPKLRLRWKGLRGVRGQVAKRLQRRLNELELPSLSAYRDYLSSHQEEWLHLDALCSITISRFYRDREVFNTISSELFPSLADRALSRDEKAVTCLSIGCCSGEEAYTLQIIWQIEMLRDQETPLSLHIIATDRNGELLDRAVRGVYKYSSLRELPQQYLETAFVPEGDTYTLREQFKQNISFVKQDIREDIPDGPFHIILCRNIVFTYFEEPLRQQVLTALTAELTPGGFFIIGSHETIVPDDVALRQYKKSGCIYQKISVEP